VVDSESLGEIVSSRNLQSIDYEAGQALAALLKGQIGSAKIASAFAAVSVDSGTFLLSPGSQVNKKYLVVDLEQSNAFKSLSDAEALFSFQKLARFLRKYWEGLSLNFSERIINGTTKAVVFPFRHTPTPFRMVIEREPRKERLSKRGMAGRFMLLYKAGFSGGDSASEEPGYTNFNRALDTLEAAQERAAAAVPNKESERSLLAVTGLTEGPAVGSMFRTFDDWDSALTKQQLDFISAPLRGAHRIEGAAGTGKTLSLILKVVRTLRDAQDANVVCHIVFITHSEATRTAIGEALTVIDSKDRFQARDRQFHAQALKVCTLSQLCTEELNQTISESELIDTDAMESKGLQLVYIGEAIKESLERDLPSHERFMTPAFVDFMRAEDNWKLAGMFQHEIGVLIKGRAAEKFHVYRDVPPLKYGLPVQNSADKGFVFSVFQRYQQALGVAGQFDTDDVVLSAIGQLDTPIWRRRRTRDGYDAIFIDETHLFNINELNLFHFFTKSEGAFPIVYSVDRSQAIGDHGWTTADIASAVAPADVNSSPVRMGTVFRCSPEILDLAYCVLSSGATLFTNFENPALSATSGFTEGDERLSRKPVYYEVANEFVLCEAAFDRADVVKKELGCRSADVLIVTLDDDLLGKLQEYALSKNKSVRLLSRRGDVGAVEAAVHSGQYVLGHADYVGGLEFQAVIIVGVDYGRVPPVAGGESESSRTFLNYSAHNRLYVAITRGRYRVDLLGERARGPSKVVRPAVDQGYLDIVEHVAT
jgi:superfamily I DNA/RNA helicase